MLPTPTLDSFQQQLASLQQSYAQLGKMIQPNTQQPTTAVNPIVSYQPDTVDGIEGARQFLNTMPANCNRTVWDTQADKFYALAKDANGNPKRIMIGSFTLTPEPSMEDKYVTKEMFDTFVARVEAAFQQKGGADNG